MTGRSRSYGQRLDTWLVAVAGFGSRRRPVGECGFLGECGGQSLFGGACVFDGGDGECNGIELFSFGAEHTDPDDVEPWDFGE